MTPADKIALAAAVIAACAFFATVWQAYLAYRHNRLSVRPLLVWHFEKSTSELGTEAKFRVSNCGVGPAIVKERFFTVNGQRFQTKAASSDQVLELAQHLFASRFQYSLLQHGLPGIEAAIPPGGEFVIARLLFPNANSSMVEAMLEQAGPVGFCIRYESLYEEPYVFLAE